LASGIASSGIGFGTLIVPPLASLLITDVGWRETYLILGVLAVIAGAGMALLIENDPRDRGLGPDGDPPQLASTLLRVPGASIKEALRSRQFIGLYAACLFCAFGVFVPFVHLVPYATDHGIAPASAVLLVSAIGIGSALGASYSAGSPTGSAASCHRRHVRLHGALASSPGRCRPASGPLAGFAPSLAHRLWRLGSLLRQW
jgi:predicted MFS family arabinose efflux permease